MNKRMVLLVAILGAAQVSFCATAEEAMLEADKIDVEILKQAIDFSRANILKQQANVLRAQNELKESKRWLCKFEQYKRELEAKDLFSRIKNVFKKMWHSYPYGLKWFKYAITDPVSLAVCGSMQYLLVVSCLLAVYNGKPLRQAATLNDCLQVQLKALSGYVGGAFVGYYGANAVAQLNDWFRRKMSKTEPVSIA